MPSSSADSNVLCAVCGALADSHAAVRLPQSHAELRVCSACGSWTYHPRRTAAAQTAAHDDESYFAHPYFTLRRTLTPELRRRCRRVVQSIAAATNGVTLAGQRMLDIGCDTGAFLIVAKEELGIIPVGIDVAGRAAAVARSNGIEAYQTDLEDAPETLTGFCAITAIDLIEHVANPAGFLREVGRRLQPGGPVYLETPNIQSFVYKFGNLLATITRGRPAALFERLFPPEHIQYFTRSSLTALARGAGLEVVQMSARILPSSDIAASLPTRLAMALLQTLDRIAGTEILICAVLRRPQAGEKNR
jgi:2-polyprenyl-3-methyl-5-hydroxy-6-metoxy-1,4-benzoquinol methylase